VEKGILPRGYYAHIISYPGALATAAKPASPKVDPALAALVALLKGKLGSSSSDATTDKCKHFAETGKCKYGEKCRYAH
jgi:hypothetical protein